MIDWLIRRRVRRGALWLDENRWGWRDVIDIERLDVHHATWCLLGQLHPEGFYGWRNDTSAAGVSRDEFYRWAIRHGFYDGALALVLGEVTINRRLTLAWRDELGKERTPVPSA